MKSIVVAIGCVLASMPVLGQSAPHGSFTATSEMQRALGNGPGNQARLSAGPGMYQRIGVVADWSQHHALYPASTNLSLMTRVQQDPRWTQQWYLHHRQVWWPGWGHGRLNPALKIHRDWNVALGATAYGPMYDFAFNIAGEVGNGSLNTFDDLGTGASNGQYFATAGSLVVTASGLVTPDLGTYPLNPAYYANPGNLLTPTSTLPLYTSGLEFTGSGHDIYAYYSLTHSPNEWAYDDNNTFLFGGTFTLNNDPGGGQTYPAKYVFDVNATPDCTNDYVVVGIPALAVAGTQANIVGYNNLYTGSGSGNVCTGTGPNVKFAYATSNGGEVPASVSISESGQKLAFVEDLFPTSADPNGSSYFHVLTPGSGAEGTNPTTGSVTPGSGSSNATDYTVPLQTSGVNQSSTTAPFIDYANDAAYVTTYTWTGTGTGSGYLYKIAPVFTSTATNLPQIVWSVPISNAVPSSPVFDVNTSKVFFTDSSGNIDFVMDNGTTASGITSLLVASGSTSENPVTIDATNGYVFATFNNSSTNNAVVVQAPESLLSFVSVPVGTGNLLFAGPYNVDFSNAWYGGSGTPLVYVAGKGSGTVPTLYSVGFTGSVMNASVATSTPLASGGNGIADASGVTEFYNTNTSTDYLFVGVDNNCIATTLGGTGGCVMSLNITGGFPTVSATSIAFPAQGGTTGIIVDNDGTGGQASNIYYAARDGITPSSFAGTGAATLVKATQAGLQ
jgi:hypothetical protein